MTGKERILTVLNRATPDRVPTMEWVFSPKVIRQMCGSESDLDFVEAFDLDGVAVGLDSKNQPFDDRHIVDEWGVKRVTYDEYPNPVNTRIADESDLEGYEMPDPDAEYRFDKIKAAIKRFGDERCVVARVRDAVSQPRDLMGYENFLCGLHVEPEVVQNLMKMSVDYSMRICENLVDIGVEVIVIGDDLATNLGLLMSPAMFRQQILPEFSRLVAHAKKLGLKVIKHSDGDLRLILQDLLDTGIDCLDPIDERGNMFMKELRATYGNTIALKGNIDCVETLVNKTPQDVRREVARCILEGGLHGGLILSSSNSIHSGISPENYKTMLEAAKELGNYPLDVELLKTTAEMV